MIGIKIKKKAYMAVGRFVDTLDGRSSIFPDERRKGQRRYTRNRDRSADGKGRGIEFRSGNRNVIFRYVI